MHAELLGVSEALEKLLTHFEPLPTEQIPLSKALSRVLAEDIFAGHPLPPFNNSSMDGYAVRSQDLIGASKISPVVLDVIGDISSGVIELMPLTEKTAMRIMTGAPLPPGADSVVPVEETSRPNAMAHQDLPENVLILTPVQKGDYIRDTGQDVSQGQKVLERGHRLRPQDIGMLAAVGIAEPLVHSIPKVALLSSGDELVDVADDLLPGFIRDSNGYSLSAAVHAVNATPLRMGIAPDDPERVEEMLQNAVETGANLIVSSAGVSMGAFDFVRSVIEKRGRLEFWRINLRPGKPLIFGFFDEVPVLGLPGNPVSALVTFEIFVRPAVDKLSGVLTTKRKKFHAILDHDIESDGRESYLRASVKWNGDTYKAKLVGSQDSGVLSSLVEANALIIIPAGVQSVEQGSIVEAWHLS